MLLLPLFLAAYAQAVQFVCHDGSVATCGDGSAPILHEGLFARGDLGTRSMCPQSCNVFRNACDATTAPTCIYPDPGVPNPRAACACRPGYKADNAADGDTTRHWRVPVPGQEHRVWVAEGVKCNALCGGYGPQSCAEVTMLGPDCVGDVVPGKYPGTSYPGGGPKYGQPYGKNTSTPRYGSSVDAPSKETDVPEEPVDTTIIPPYPNESEDPYPKNPSEPSEPSEPEDPYPTDSEDPANETIVDDPLIPSDTIPVPSDEGGDSTDIDLEPTSTDSSSSTDVPGDTTTEPIVDGFDSTTESLSEATESVSDTSTDGNDIPSDLPTTALDIDIDASLFTNVPIQTGTPSKDWTIPDYLGQSDGEEASPSDNEDAPKPFKMPRKRSQPRRRDDGTPDYRALGEEQGWPIFTKQWNWFMNKLSGTHTEFKNMDERPALCNNIQDSVFSACKNAIDTQNVNCGLSQSGKDPRCKTSSLGKECCDKQRQDGYWCRGRWSNENFATALSNMQESCGIITAGGREALKLGLYRRLLGPLVEIIKESKMNLKIYQEVAERQQKWLLWERELRYLVGGDAGRGIKGLYEFTGNMPRGDKGSNGVRWSEAIEEPMSKNLDAFMRKVIGIAFDVFAVRRERDFLAGLDEGSVPSKDDMMGVRNWAFKYVIERIWIFQPIAPGRFGWQKDQKEFDESLKAYKTFVESTWLFDLARVWAVVIRVDRVR